MRMRGDSGLSMVSFYFARRNGEARSSTLFHAPRVCCLVSLAGRRENLVGAYSFFTLRHKP
jgi:hypothetical protein